MSKERGQQATAEASNTYSKPKSAFCTLSASFFNSVIPVTILYPRELGDDRVTLTLERLLPWDTGTVCKHKQSLRPTVFHEGFR